MTTQGRTIRIFLAEGLPDGLRTAEIINWTGKMLVFPRAQLPSVVARAEIRRAGVYVLIGDDPDDPTRERIYIGESEEVLGRLKSHDGDSDKDFWSRTVVVISKDENLTKAHVRYLESRLIRLARGAGRAVVENGTSPTPITLPESDQADMEFFLAQIQILLPVLGFPFTQQLPSTVATAVTPTTTTAAPSPVLVMNYGGATAEAVEVTGSFIVRAGSTLKATIGQGLGDSYRRKREQLRADNKFVDTGQPELWSFAEDVEFDSPSAAAAVIAGSNVNGRTAWKLKTTQQTYKDWKAAELNLAAAAAPATSENAQLSIDI